MQIGVPLQAAAGAARVAAEPQITRTSEVRGHTIKIEIPSDALPASPVLAAASRLARVRIH